MRTGATMFGVLLLALATTTQAQDWPGWRGPTGDGISKETGFPLRWSETRGVAWKVGIPGVGHSSPIVQGDRVFLTTHDGEGRKLICIDRRSGKTIWSRVVLASPKERKHRENSYASSTPVTDGKHLWVAFLDAPQFRVYCYDLDGKLVWKRNPGQFHSVHGFCSSPVLYKETVIFNGDQDAVAWIIAMEKKTGAIRWRTDRPNRTRSYVPPVIYQAAGRPQLVLSGSKCVTSYDPDTGKRIWIVDGPTEQYVASMVYSVDTFFMVGGFPQRWVMGIRPNGSGNVTDSHVIWKEENRRIAGYVPSPVAIGPYVYLVEDRGVASCLEVKTGKHRWNEQLGRPRKAKHRASPVAAGGYLYFPDSDGTTYVIKASPKFERVAENKLDEACYASPALSRGQIFLRTQSHLYCIGGK